MRMVVGLDHPTSGSVTVNGKECSGSPAPLHEVGGAGPLLGWPAGASVQGPAQMSALPSLTMGAGAEIDRGVRTGTAQSQLPRPAAPRRRRRRWVVVPLCLLAALVWSVGSALISPGSDSTSARLAEWARGHHLGGLVNELERLQYDAHPPAVGGRPASGLGPLASAPTAAAAVVAVAHLAFPAQLRTPATLPLAGEGVWRVLAQVGGAPAVLATELRPDVAHSSYLTGVAWMDPTLVRLVLHPGTVEPGGRWRTPSLIAPAAQNDVLAAFNSGFTLADSCGGYYAEGRTVRPLRQGAASFVVFADGRATVQAWGAGPRLPGPGIASVRQNLDLLVDGGRPDASVDSGSTAKWGRTLGNKLFVWRSGIGVTKTGALVYVAGAAMSTRTLAEMLVRAGAQRAMELDINPYWTSYDYFSHPSGGGIVAHRLTADEQRAPGRYLSSNTRDFYTVQAR